MSQSLHDLLVCLPNDLSAFARTSADVEDWSALFAEAERHGVQWMLTHCIQEAGIRIQEDVWASLVRQRFVHLVRQTSLRESTLHVLGTLEADDIRAIPLKGAVLAERLYPDPTTRPSSDVDILIRPQDLDRAIACLDRVGYRYVDDVESRYARQHLHHVSLRSASQAFLVELHFCAYRGFGAELPSSALFDRSQPTSLADGASLTTPEPEDEFLYLLVHSAGNFILQFKWLLDQKLFLSRHPGLDVDVVEQRAKAFGLGNAVNFGLIDLERNLGVEVTKCADVRASMRIRLAFALRKSIAVAPRSRPWRTLISVLGTGLLCDRLGATFRYWRHHFLRIAKRRAWRYLPQIAPEKWAG